VEDSVRPREPLTVRRRHNGYTGLSCSTAGRKEMKNLMAMLYIYDLAVIEEVSARVEKKSLDILYSRKPEIIGDY
jgi:hypothetical protein